MQNKNPIFIEYSTKPGYDCDCYKIMLPYEEYGVKTITLCRVSEGYDFAKTIAVGVIVRNLTDIIKIPPEFDA
jgi:hypothetical protein